jgi:hypothetical protein
MTRKCSCELCCVSTRSRAKEPELLLDLTSDPLVVQGLCMQHRVIYEIIKVRRVTYECFRRWTTSRRVAVR